MHIVIPAQTKSVRVPLKNIRPFSEGKSLLDIKIEQLLSVFDANDIYISSEDEIVFEVCKHYAVNFIPRPLNLTGNEILQYDLIKNILKSLPNDDQDIMWVQVTQPLFDDFIGFKEKWNEVKNTNDSLVAVKTLRHHIVSEAGIPINFNFGHWHKVSQKLPKFYEILWSAFIQKRKSIETTGYHIGMNPCYYPCDDIFTLDIDTLDDFEMASIIYKYKKSK